MIKHLDKEHHIKIGASSVAQKRDAEGLDVASGIRRTSEVSLELQIRRRNELLASGINKSTLIFFIRLISRLDLSFRCVQVHDLRLFIEYINPAANLSLPNSGATIKSHVLQLFVEGQRRISYILSCAVTDIHISCDVWTATNNLPALAIVAHFADEKLKRQDLLLALQGIQGQHTGENLAAMIIKVLDNFKIRNRLGYFVGDNATVNDKILRLIADALNKEGVNYNPDHRRLRCLGHVINLAVQEFLFGSKVNDYEYSNESTFSPSDQQIQQWRKIGPLGKLHNVIIHIMASPQRVQKFKSLSGGLLPIRDNSTRWNSWYLMIDRAVSKIKSAIQLYIADDESLASDTLSSDDWRLLISIQKILKNFYDATKASESSKAALDLTLRTVDFIIASFEEALEEFNEHDVLRESLHAGLTLITSYWNKYQFSPVYTTAIVLDPREKMDYFKKWNADWAPNLRSDVRTFWETTYLSSTTITPSKPSAQKQTDNAFFLWRNRMRDESVSNGDELERYLTEPRVNFSDDEPAFDWWIQSEQRERFPLLSKMAIDIFSVPPMSAEPERVFSGAKLTITHQRNRLKMNTIEALQCLKSWFRAEIFTDVTLNDVVDHEMELDEEDL